MLSRMTQTQPVQTRSPVPRVNLGAVFLDAAPGWRFYPIKGRVIGRPPGGVGVFQVLPIPAHMLPMSPSHEQCMAAAVAATGNDVQPPGFDRAKEYSESCMAGGESFHSGSDFVRVWYRRCPKGTIVARFACPNDRVAERSVLESIRDGDRMIASAQAALPMA
jgi:hypothetical protein